MWKSTEFMKPKVIGGRISSSLLLHMNCHAGCCQENARPRACFVFLGQFCFSNVKELPACSTPLLLYLFTYWHVGQFHQDTLLPFGAVSVHSCVTYCCPSAFHVMWLHSIPYLCWSIFLLLLPLIINGCLSKSFIIFFSDLLCSFSSHLGLPDAWLLVCLLLIARFRGNRWRRGSGEETRPWP